MENLNNIFEIDWTLLKNDKLYDGKSLIWEDNKLTEIKDNLDKNNIPEGRLGEFPIKKINISMGLDLFLPVVKKNKDLINTHDIIDTPKLYQMLSENRILKIERLENNEYHTKSLEYNNLESMQNISTTDNKETLQIYEGILNTEKYGAMVGIITFLPGTKDTASSFTYAGTGNYTDIKMEKDIILKRLIRSIKKYDK